MTVLDRLNDACRPILQSWWTVAFIALLTAANVYVIMAEKVL